MCHDENYRHSDQIDINIASIPLRNKKIISPLAPNPSAGHMLNAGGIRAGRCIDIQSVAGCRAQFGVGSWRAIRNNSRRA